VFHIGVQRVLEVSMDHAEEIEDLTQEMREDLEALQSAGPNSQKYTHTDSLSLSRSLSHTGAAVCKH
jgi:hypothetical protein